MLACKLRMTVGYYDRIERGQALPSVSVFARLVDALELDATELLATLPTSEPDAGDESPEVHRLLARLRTAKPATRRVIGWVLAELERRR